MRLIDNTAALQANLLSGDIDMVAPGNLGLTLDQTIALSKTQAQKFDFFYQPAVTSYEHLTVQLDNPLLADRRVRQAMSMAVDRKTITARLFDNRQDPALSFVHPSQAAWDPSVKTWPYDPAAARALLAAAGFHAGADGILVSPAGQRFSVDIVTTAGNRTRELVEQVLQTEFRAVGIELVVKNVPARVMFGETLRKREFTGLVMFQADRRWIPCRNIRFPADGFRAPRTTGRATTTWVTATRRWMRRWRPRSASSMRASGMTIGRRSSTSRARTSRRSICSSQPISR
jgi:peptide/nickel transport system substrate-binding protein